MPHLSIERPHHLSQRQAKELAERLAHDFEGRFGLAWHWDGDAIRFTTPADWDLFIDTKGWLRAA